MEKTYTVWLGFNVVEGYGLSILIFKTDTPLVLEDFRSVKYVHCAFQ